MANIEYDAPNKEEMLADASTALDLATGFEVNTQATYELAAEEVRDAKRAIAALTERRLGITRKFDDLKKDVMELFTPALKRWEEVKVTYEHRMISFVQQQELERRKEAERLEALARAERERLAEEARKAEAAATKTKDANKAEQLRAEAEAARLTAQVITAPAVQTSAPVAQVTSIRKTWKAKVEDKAKLVKFVSDHPEYLNLLDVNESALNAVARAQHENMSIGGCKAYEEQSVTSRK